MSIGDSLRRLYLLFSPILIYDKYNVISTLFYIELTLSMMQPWPAYQHVAPQLERLGRYTIYPHVMLLADGSC